MRFKGKAKAMFYIFFKILEKKKKNSNGREILDKLNDYIHAN